MPLDSILSLFSISGEDYKQAIERNITFSFSDQENKLPWEEELGSDYPSSFNPIGYSPAINYFENLNEESYVIGMPQAFI